MKQIYNPLAGYLLRNYNKRFIIHKGFSVVGFTYFLRQLLQYKKFSDEVVFQLLM
jgi:hypothetical protein